MDNAVSTTSTPAPTAGAVVEACRFDPVSEQIDGIDLTNPLIVHSALRRLQDEVRYWRQTAGVYLWNAIHDVERPSDVSGWRAFNGPRAQLKEHVTVLNEALEGRFFDACPDCGGDIRPGDPIITYEDEGPGHAACAGATPADIAAGRITVDIESIDLDLLEPEDAAEARRDPHAGIRPFAEMFTAEQIVALVERGAALLARLDREDEAGEATSAASFAASQDEVGARYGVTPNPDRDSVPKCRAWFTDRHDAIQHAVPRAMAVWDLVEGKPLAAVAGDPA